MCILFLYTSDNPTLDTFKVILAVNRDEMYKRPTKMASFWGTQPDILGGRDMEPGREGGTWLAINRTGRIAALLNVLQSKESLQSAGLRKGRGFLVNNLLLNPSIDAKQYLTEIQKDAAEYNPFSMLTVDVQHRDTPQVCYYSCSEDNEPQELSSGKVYGVGNSFIGSPFLKVKSGKEAFANVVQDNNHITKKDTLVKGILDVLKNQERRHPDPQMHNQAPDQPEEFLRGISSRFIRLPGYGTRTHTIILIDFNNKVFYQEHTLSDPIDEKDPKWSCSSFEFETNECL